MFVNPIVSNLKKYIEVERKEQILTNPLKEQIIESEEEDKLTLDFIIKNKPKTKIVRQYFENKCNDVKDEDMLIFESK